ncbi:MAG: redox-sensing transcriptional repressor Rex [Candidatus Marinimicrobia bacterium]|nr:redox-sensing transcriptional repressor Rex [Candidatus Neomarinimicrobiota bacterium]
MELNTTTKISEAVIRRLTDYLRCIRCAGEAGRDMLTSLEISERCGLNASIVRKDLAQFGAYGVKGMGYNVRDLTRQINKILGLDKLKDVVLVGAGHLGTAIIRYPGFADVNFNFIAAFDTDPEKIGKTIGYAKVYPLEELKPFIRKHAIQIVVLTVPSSEAQAIVNDLDPGYVKGVLNFTAVIFPPKQNNMFVHNIDLAKELEVISYCMKNCLSQGS